MSKIKFRFDEKKLKKRGIAFLILDPIIFILLLKFTQQPYALDFYLVLLRTQYVFLSKLYIFIKVL